MCQDGMPLISPADPVSRYAYANDTVARRKSVVMTGTAFTGQGGDHQWRWGYNDRSELTLDTPGNAGAFGQGPAGFARPAERKGGRNRYS